MNRKQDSQAHSFKLSQGPSDIGLLFAVIGFGLLQLIVPQVLPWAFRILLFAMVFLLLRHIIITRGLIRVGARDRSRDGPIGNIVAIAVLIFLVWFIVSGINAGNWFDVGLAFIVLGETVYLEFLVHKRSG